MEEKLKFTEEAKLDIKEAATYYNEVESHKLADDFLSSINEKIIQILIKPNAYSEDSDGVGKTTIRRFPYNIYYISISPSLLIIAIWHKKRNPDNLKNRIDKIKNK